MYDLKGQRLGNFVGLGGRLGRNLLRRKGQGDSQEPRTDPHKILIKRHSWIAQGTVIAHHPRTDPFAVKRPGST